MAKISPASSPPGSPTTAMTSSLSVVRSDVPNSGALKRRRMDSYEAGDPRQEIMSRTTTVQPVHLPIEGTEGRSDNPSAPEHDEQIPPRSSFQSMATTGDVEQDQATRSVQTAPASHIPSARVMELLDYACTAGRWFSMSMVPRRTDWVVLNNNRKTTALSYMDQVVNLFVIGKIQSMVIYVGRAPDNPTVRLALELMREIDRAAHLDLLRLVHHHGAGQNLSTMRTTTDGGEQGRACLRRCYDATNGYTNKDDMARMDMTRLAVGDVVLAECWYVRNEIYGGWTTSFKLRALSLLEIGDVGRRTPIVTDDMRFPWEL